MLVFDGTDNPVGLLRNSATVSFTYKYDPWGVQTLTSSGTGNGAGQNPYAFHGGIKDPGSGLVKTARGAAAFLAGLIGGAITGCIAGAVAGLFSAGILSGPASIAGLIGAGFAGALGATATDATLQLYGF
jgi:hypothetical protein